MRFIRAAMLLGIGISAFLAVHDLLGYKDPDSVLTIAASAYHTFFAAIRLLMIAIAATIALTRFERRDARTLARGLLGLSLNNYWFWYAQSDALFWPAVIFNYGGIALGAAGFVRFASTYGSGDWHHLRKAISWTAPVLFAAMSVSGTLFVALPVAFATEAPQLNQCFWALWDVANVLIIVASLIAWKQSVPAERNAMAIVAVTFAIFTGGTALHGIDRIFQGDTLWANNVDALAQAALPIGLGYVILRHRFLDIRFVINEAVIYATLGAIVVVIFNLVDRAVTGYVSSVNATAVTGAQTRKLVDLSASIVIATALPRLREGVSLFVRSFVFRRRDLDLTALKHFGQTVDAGATAAEIIDQVAAALREHARVPDSCFYLGAGDGRLHPRGNTLPQKLEPLDERAIWKALESRHGDSFPANEIDAALPEGTVFPVVARSRVRAMLLCGKRPEPLARDEQTGIREMVNSAMLAIDDARLLQLSS